MKLGLVFFIFCVLLVAQPGAPVGGYGGAVVGSSTNPNGTVCVVNTAVALLFQSTIYTCQSGTYQPLSAGGVATNFPITVSGTVNSGGIPCFTSTTNEASSSALTANLPVIGGGAGTCPTVGTVAGNTTKFATVSGSLTSTHGVVIDASGNIIDSGAVPSGGTGNAAATVSVNGGVFTATPTFTCPSSTAGTVVDFLLPISTGNITSSTLASCTTGSLLNFRFIQDGTGGRTFIPPTGFESCFLNPAANAGTKCSYFWDGTNARLLSNTGDVGYSAGQCVSAPGTPPSGDFFSWCDSGNTVFSFKNPSGTTSNTVVPSTAAANQFATAVSATGVVSYAAITNAALPAVTLNTGTARTVANQSEIFICTAACTVTPLTPIAGTQLCVQLDDNVAAAITLAAVTNVQYENVARTSYKAAATTLASSGVVKDQICIVGKDATHYNVWSNIGTWN